MPFDLNPILNELSPGWVSQKRKRQVLITDPAMRRIAEISTETGIDIDTLVSEVAENFLMFLMQFKGSEWFKQCPLHLFSGIAVGDPDNHPEFACDKSYFFSAIWQGERSSTIIFIGLEEDAKLPEQYMINQTIEIARLYESRL